MRDLFASLRASVATLLICSAAYPAAVWAIARVAFPTQAEGSLVRSGDGEVIGSSLIAQPFAGDRYFHPRPSAVDYKADAAGGSNLGPNAPDLRAKAVARVAALGATDDRKAPVDLVLASGSGLDPEISPEAASYQVGRVASARGLAADRVGAIVDAHVETSGAILGAPPRVNVLSLNLALDALGK